MTRFMLGLLALALSAQAYAFPDGRVTGGTSCGGCHGATSASVTTTLTGPTTLLAGTSATYTVSITPGTSAGGGLNVAIAPSSLAGSTLGLLDANTKLASGTSSAVPQLTHVNGLADAPAGNKGDWTYSFLVNAPQAAGTILLNAVMLAFDGDGSNAGDLWDATTLAIQVVLPEPSTLLLLGAGVATIVGIRLRRRAGAE